MQLYIAYEYETNIALIMSSINYGIFSKFKWQWVGHRCRRIDGLEKMGDRGWFMSSSGQRKIEEKETLCRALTSSCINS